MFENIIYTDPHGKCPKTNEEVEQTTFLEDGEFITTCSGKCDGPRKNCEELKLFAEMVLDGEGKDYGVSKVIIKDSFIDIDEEEIEEPTIA